MARAGTRARQQGKKRKETAPSRPKKTTAVIKKVDKTKVAYKVR